MLLVAAARRRAAGAAPDLFAEILGGRPARPLPESVLRALEELERRPPFYSGVAGVSEDGASS